MKSNATLKTWTIASLSLVLIIDSVGIGIIFPLLGPLFFGQTSIISHASLALRELYYGLTIAIFPVFMFFGAPFLGDLSDYIGRKKVLLFSLYGSAVGLAILMFGVILKSVGLLIFGRAFLGVLAASQATAQATMIDISTPTNRAINLSYVSIANNVG